MCTYISSYYKVTLLLATISLAQTLHAQDSSRRKTIDITSSFKPVLRTPEKLGFTASAATGDTSRPRLSYNLPIQQLALAYQPSSLRPLAYEHDSLVKANNAYLKAGFGNFTTPFVQGILGFGAGKPTNGSLSGLYHSSKGSLPFQQFARYGVRGDVYTPAGASHLLKATAGYEGYQTYRYGYGAKNEPPNGDTLKVNYNTLAVSGQLSNIVPNGPGVNYEATAGMHYFMDNADGREFAFSFDVPFTKSIGEKTLVGVGLKGMLANFTHTDTSFNNNYISVPVYAAWKMQQGWQIHAGLTPTWIGKQFHLLPDILLAIAKAESPVIFEVGFKGRVETNTYRSVAQYNPWVVPPVDGLRHSRSMELVAGVKSALPNNLTYKLSAAFGKVYDVPLFINDALDGKSFMIGQEASLNRVSLRGELIYQQADRLYWSTMLGLNGYSNLSLYDKAYGLLPFELRSSLQMKITRQLRIKADVYSLNGAWYRNKSGGNSRTKAALDLNAGAEFDLTEKWRVWLSFNNILNQDYERWNQYRVLGFQAIGGVIFHL